MLDFNPHFSSLEQQTVCANKTAWKYLLSNKLVFEKNMVHGIRIKKPHQQLLSQWVRRLVSSGCCDTIYIENFTSHHHMAAELITLCSQHGVTLVSLQIDEGSHAIKVQPLCGKLH